MIWESEAICLIWFCGAAQLPCCFRCGLKRFGCLVYAFLFLFVVQNNGLVCSLMVVCWWFVLIYIILCGLLSKIRYFCEYV